MAKAKHGEKSQAIRAHLTANPTATGSEVVEALKAKGLRVSKQAVSTVRGRMAAKPKKRGRRKKRAVGKNGAMVSLGVLVQAKKLAESLGGVRKAKEALDALAKLQ